ncbi:MAG: glycerol acyltransferase [Bacteroides sp. SM1_62]|nr:MAG: glycerol acyltransferase [Bacteroides sp. SM23_62]KPL26232.1 MAG: glycerol acyltransferase [Bacteroides sp. SM1_62]
MTDISKAPEIQKIDIKKIFYEKSPRLARLIPGFVYAYLKKILHLDFVNGYMERHGDKMGLEFLEPAYREFNVKMEVIGEEHLPAEGRFLLVANHPLGGFDGSMLIYIMRQHYPKVIFLVNDILMNLKNLEEVFVPINKHGGQSRESVKQLDAAYRSEMQILSFPSGMVSRKIKGNIQDLEWQKNFILKAVQYGRDVIPIHVSGRNSNFFYRLARLRKFFGIRWNLEMLYLPDETYKQRNKTFIFTIGKPIAHTVFDHSHSPMEWAARVRDLVYRLPENKEASLRDEKK